MGWSDIADGIAGKNPAQDAQKSHLTSLAALACKARDASDLARDAFNKRREELKAAMEEAGVSTVEVQDRPPIKLKKIKGAPITTKKELTRHLGKEQCAELWGKLERKKDAVTLDVPKMPEDEPEPE